MKIMPMLFAALLLAACDSPWWSKEPSKEAQVSARNLTERGYQLIAEGQPRAAVAIFDQAIGSDAKNIRAWQGKGIALNKLGKHDEAEAVYEQGLKIEPDAVGLTNNLAMSKILRGQYQEAIDVLAPLASSEKENDTVMENLALANCLLGKREDARKLYSKRLPPAEIQDNLRFCKTYEELKRKK